MKALRRRDKTKSRCNPDWKHHDKRLLTHLVHKVGCSPKHWKLESNLPNCSQIEQYKELNERMYKSNEYMPPCRSIERLSTITKGVWKSIQINCQVQGGNYLDLLFYLDGETMYEENILVASFTFKSLIGNAGNLLWLCRIASNFKMLKL